MIVIVTLLLILIAPFLRFCLRLFFLKGKINRFCKKKGYEVSWNRDPFPSAMSPQKGFDFSVKTPQHCYRVKLFAARHRFREYCFINESEVAVYRKISFNLIARGRGLRGMGLFNSVDFGLMAKNLPLDLPEDGTEGAQKILLFYPIAKDVTWISNGGSKKYLGNGDLFYKGFRMMSRSAFMEELSSPGKYLRSVKSWEEY